MDRTILILPLVFLAPACCAAAQDVFKCTDRDGRVTYQQARCPSTDHERQVDVSPANPDFDLSGRDRVLKQEEALDRRLEARASAERVAQKERDERDARERMVKAQESRAAAAEQPVYLVAGWWRPRPRASGPPTSLSMSRRQAHDNRP